ncbi:PadR family transcriptional regulator [Streptomyces roseoverticillatus]|uniref:PadR family transcriptional regulator n=1 Tax=Streptomyces roseoverticillatus TaxID=66429 RepID=A0ABV3IVQ9_9ACTN
MSDTPRIGYGQIRFHLLDLLGRRPRHGYELLAALSDKFAGTYRPSPGAVYPRLRRMEAEGLIRHENVGGRKVYHLTSAGRQQLTHQEPADARPGTEGEAEGEKDGEQPPPPPIGRLSEAIRSDVESIVRDFRRQFTTAMDRPARTSDERDWLSWAAWPTPPQAHPDTRQEFQQQLDGLITAAQHLLTAESVPDATLTEAARLLADTTATLLSHGRKIEED